VLAKIALWYQNHLSLRASKKIVTEEEFVPLSKGKSKFLSDFVVADIF
jgi:FSR family fosmidomycin resistance protein-like MFS transporter